MVEKILAIQNAPGEHLGYFEDILEDQGVPFEYSTPSLFPPLRDFSRIIVLGGPMGVYEDEKYPFLREETMYIQKAFSLDIPILGVCLGAQLMASSLGSRVFPGKRKELGWRPIRLTAAGENDEVMSTLPSEFTAFHWHGDTFTLPENIHPLASSSMYENQVFRYDNSYALQFHLEITEEMVKEWVQELDKKQGEDIVYSTKDHIGALNDMAEKFLKSWLEL